MDISWTVGVGWAIFCLFLIGFIWRRDDVHYDEQEEKYQEAMRKKLTERNGKNDKDRPK